VAMKGDQSNALRINRTTAYDRAQQTAAADGWPWTAGALDSTPPLQSRVVGPREKDKMMTNTDIIAGGIMLMVIPVFICLPFYIVKLSAAEAIRDPKYLPWVKQRLWTRTISSGCILAIGGYSIFSRGTVGIWQLGVLAFLAAMPAWCLGYLLVLRKAERNHKMPQPTAAASPSVDR